VFNYILFSLFSIILSMHHFGAENKNPTQHPRQSHGESPKHLYIHTSNNYYFLIVIPMSKQIAMRMGIKSGKVHQFVSIISLLISMQLMKLYYEVQSMKLFRCWCYFLLHLIKSLRCPSSNVCSWVLSLSMHHLQQGLKHLLKI